MRTIPNYPGRSLYFSSGMKHITENDNERDVKNDAMVYGKIKFRAESYQKRKVIVREFRRTKIKGNLIKKSF